MKGSRLVWVLAAWLLSTMPSAGLAAGVDPDWSFFPGFHLPGKDGIQILDPDDSGARVVVSTGSDRGGFNYQDLVLLVVMEKDGPTHRISRKVVLPAGVHPVGSILRYRRQGHAGDLLAVPVADSNWAQTSPRLLTYGGSALELLADTPLPYQFRVADVFDLDGDGVPELIGTFGSSFQSGSPGVVDLDSGALVWTDPQLEILHIAAGEIGNHLPVLILGNLSPDVGLVLDAVTREQLWSWPDGFRGRAIFGNFIGPATDREFAIVEPWGSIKIFRAAPSFSPMTQLDLDQIGAAVSFDLDQDGYDEIIIGSSQGRAIQAYEPRSGTKVLDLISSESGISALEIGLLETGGGLQLVHNAGLSSTGVDILNVVDLDTGQGAYQMRDEQGPFSSLIVADILGNGVRQVAAATMYSESGYRGPNLRLLDAATGTQLRYRASVLDPWASDFGLNLAVGQIDGDPQLEIFASNSHLYSPKIVALDGQTLETQWENHFVDEQGSVDQVLVVDVNEDGVDDLVASLSGRIIFINGNDGSEIWRSVRFNVNGPTTLAAGAFGSGSDLAIAIGVGTRVYVLDVKKHAIVRIHEMDDMVIDQHVETVDGQCVHVLTFAGRLQRRECAYGEVRSERELVMPGIFVGYPADSFGDVVVSDGRRVVVDRDGVVVVEASQFDHDLGAMNRGQVIAGNGEVQVFLGGSLGVHRIRLETGSMFANGFEIP